MGINTSFMGGKGLSTSQVVNLVLNTLYKRFVEKDTKEFDAFHAAILDTFNTVNMALPGKHYDAPSYEDVTEFFEGWQEANEEGREKMFTDFMNKSVNRNKVDESMIVTAIVAPPAAMLAKRTGQTVPQLKLMNAIPDVVFVPSATVLALIAVKILRLMFMGNTTSKGASTGSHVDHVVQHSSANNIPSPTLPPSPSPSPETASDSPQDPPESTASESHVVQHSSANNIPSPITPPSPSPETASDSPQDTPETASEAHQHTPKGKYCRMCAKVH